MCRGDDYMPDLGKRDNAKPQINPYNGNGKILVRSYGSHRRLFPDGDTIEVDYIEGETVRALLDRLKVPDEEVWLVTIGEEIVEEDFVLSPGDTVNIMSPVLGG
jgi:sulfur carrier protein ThiS